MKKVLREPTERQVKSDRLWKLDKTRVVLVTVLDDFLLYAFQNSYKLAKTTSNIPKSNIELIEKLVNEEFYKNMKLV